MFRQHRLRGGVPRHDTLGEHPMRFGEILTTVEAALKTAGEEAVYYHTTLTGASNGRARAKLGFAPRPLLWKRQRDVVS